MEEAGLGSMEEDEVLDTEMEERGEVPSYAQPQVPIHPAPRAPKAPNRQEAANNLASIFASVMDDKSAMSFSHSLLSEYGEDKGNKNKKEKESELLKEQRIARRKEESAALARTYEKITEGDLQSLDPASDILAPFLPYLVRLASEVPKFSWLIAKLSTFPQVILQQNNCQSCAKVSYPGKCDQSLPAGSGLSKPSRLAF